MAATTRKKSLLNGVLYFTNIIFAFALLGSYLAYYIDPNWLTFFAFLALAYPVLLLINVLFIIYWALRGRIKIMLSIICIAAGYLHFNRFYQISSSNKLVNPTEQLRVMSYNVRMFNAYKWIPEEGIPEQIKQTVYNEFPDVLLLQEYYKGSITPKFKFEYEYIKPTNISGNYGLTIHSKYPIVKSGALELLDLETDQPSYNNQFIYADIDYKGKIIRFMNVHLASVGLEASDYQRLQNPNEGSQEEIKDDFLKIFNRLDIAFKKRAKQVLSLKKAINHSPHPVVVCGDFNDTPQSYTYHQINVLLADAFMQGGEGFGKTYARGPIPFRIDHIFHSKEIKARSFKVIDKKLSDHYPVVVELEF